MLDLRQEDHLKLMQELNNNYYFQLRDIWGLGHVRIAYEQCGFHKDSLFSPYLCKSHIAIRMPYGSNESYCQKRFYGTYIDRKTKRKREIQIGRDTIENTMLSVVEIKRRVTSGPFH